MSLIEEYINYLIEYNTNNEIWCQLKFDENLMNEKDEFIINYCQKSENYGDFYFLKSNIDKAKEYLIESLISNFLKKEESDKIKIENLKEKVEELEKEILRINHEYTFICNP